MSRPAAGAMEAVLVGDLDVDAPIPALERAGRYREARLLVRLHTRPVGEVVVPLSHDRLAPDRVVEAVWSQLGDRIVDHMVVDQLPAPRMLSTAGLIDSPAPPCLERRSTMTVPSVTVMVATRDRTESVLRCLKSLEALDYPSFDVVVVDSAPSTPETERALTGGHSWRYPFTYVRADRPGLAFAHNTALPAVTGEVVAFTDDDVQVDSHWLMALAEGFDDPAVTCVTGLILAAELETPAQLLLEQSGGFARGYVERRFSLNNPPDDQLFPFTAGRFGSGANMAFRTDWLRGHGGFDWATGAGTPARGGDDLLSFLHVILDGGDLVYQPAAILRHWHRREYAGLRRQAFGYGVGLGSYLAASACAQPSLVPVMLRRGVPALRHMLGSASAKNRGRRPGFPSELIWRERAGLVAGPFAYTASRWRYRGTRDSTRQGADR
ncbi:glycosyltransferase [Rhodococcus spelaei]|uniref:Glycosyltransferase n=1 Tax=Rhodococcus spelaei TaxID=2546320 RepID=A0A541BNP2_9NOCA|nr:glycosyltransferase family 2 protein [Rhodococcus spelaei]TQF73949.1 glycosyltransferase [Rhodococcus spelaei]